MCYCIGTEAGAPAHCPSHPDYGLAVRCTSTLVLGKSVLHAVPAALQRLLQDDHVLKSGVNSLDDSVRFEEMPVQKITKRVKLAGVI